jgi:hypothetical protein
VVDINENLENLENIENLKNLENLENMQNDNHLNIIHYYLLYYIALCQKYIIYQNQNLL